MKKSDVVIGQSYIVKVSGLQRAVSIIGVNRLGGWDGIVHATGRTIRIKTAARLRRVAVPGDIRQPPGYP